MAPLPTQDVDRVTAWCRTRLPESVRDRVRTECDVADGYLTILEARPPWHDESAPAWSRCPVARLQFAGTWTLYWRDRRGTFQPYDFIAPTPQVDELLVELDRDPISIFWG